MLVEIAKRLDYWGNWYFEGKPSPRNSHFDVLGTPPGEYHWRYQTRDSAGKFQTGLRDFQIEIEDAVRTRRALSVLKFGDGDYYFLRGIHVGSAAPGYRAISRPVPTRLLKESRKSAISSSLMVCELPLSNRAMFKVLFPNRTPDFPAEYIYGLVSAAWFTKNFKANKIGLIGANRKLRIISELLNYSEYQDALEIENFSDFIPVPDKFAADDPHGLLSYLERELANSSADFFLVGLGHVKSWLLPKLPQIYTAPFIDIGSGIDALAGIIDTGRPYMASWTNFQVSDRSLYDDVDYLNFNGANIKLLS